MHHYLPDEPIAALATPLAESAIGVIRVSGPDCLTLLDPLFRSRRTIATLNEVPGGSMLYGKLFSPDGKLLDEIMMGIFHAPSSYTGQDSAELYCHGNPPGIQRILSELCNAGFRMARPGEFTFRAFLNKKLDLTQAEAVHEIVRSKTREAQSLALNRLGGGLGRRIQDFRDRGVSLLAGLEVQLDYGEDEVDDIDFPETEVIQLQEEISVLAESYRTGKMYQDGFRVALSGRTNAGKSSLYNLFVREDRAIVSSEHGTTRDYLESWLSVRGIPVRLYDTAGLRDTEHAVEEEGIRRSRTIMGGADVIIYLVDGTEDISGEDERELARLKGNVIRVWNKCDIASGNPPDGWYPISTVTAAGFNDLEAILFSVLTDGAVIPDDGLVIDSQRQKQQLDRAAEAFLQAVEGNRAGYPVDVLASAVADGVEALGEIVGAVTRDDIMDTLFSNFCVGK